MTSTICTIGFTQKSAQEFFALLQDAGVRRLIDVRENRGGQLAGFAKHPDLEFFLQSVAGIDYLYDPLLAPSPSIREAYRATRDWQQYETSFLRLMQERNVPEAVAPGSYEGIVALLCSEPTAEKCHRRLVAELLAAHWNVQGHAVSVKHLALDRSIQSQGERNHRRGRRK